MKYCAYQERCHREVRNKLYEWGLLKNEVENIMARLVTDGFLNEERFAKVFAGGKFRMKKWGTVKIENELKKRDVSEYCIQQGLKEIEASDYEKILIELIEKKWREITEKDLFVKRNKTAKYLIAKGYEGELVWKKIRGKC